MVSPVVTHQAAPREGCVEEVELAVVSHRASVAPAARRIDAVEEIQPGVDRFEKVADGTDAHEITGLFVRKQRRRFARRRIHLLARLTDGEPADGVPRKVERHQLARTTLPQRRVQPALHDSKERRGRRLARGDGAPGPQRRQAHGLSDLVRSRGELHANIEHHCHIAPDGLLKLNNVLGCKPMLAPINVRPKRDTVVIDFTSALQTENLKASGVRENWPFPRHKAMKSPGVLNNLSPGPQPKMIRICKHDLRLRLGHVTRRQSLHRPRRPDRHKTRRLHNSVRELQPPTPSITVFS